MRYRFFGAPENARTRKPRTRSRGIYCVVFLTIEGDNRPLRGIINGLPAISGPSLARASSGALANKPADKNIAISGPSLARASSGAPANEPLKRNLPFGEAGQKARGDSKRVHEFDLLRI